MTTSDRIEQQSFCYDPDFPPDVPEGAPLASAAASGKQHPHTPAEPIRRALRACTAALSRRDRS